MPVCLCIVAPSLAQQVAPASSPVTIGDVIAKATPSSAQRAISLLRGRRLMERGAAAEAEPIFKAVLAEADPAGDQLSAVRAERGVGRARGMQGDDAGAERWFAAAEARATAHGLPAEYGATRILRGNAAYARGDHDAAAGFWRQALESAEIADAGDVEVQALRGLSFVSGLDDARGYLERALAAARRSALKPEEGPILHALSDNAYLRGQWTRAMAFLADAEPIVTVSGTPIEQVRLQLSWARLHKSHGQTQRALIDYRGAVAALDKVGRVIGASTAWATAASGLMLLGHADEALAPVEHAVALAIESSNRFDETIARTIHAEVLNVLGRPTEALSTATADRADPDYRSLIVQRAVALSLLRRHDEALTAARAAEAIPVSVFEALPSDLATIAEVQRRAGALDDALQNARRAVDTLERLRSEALPFDQMKVGFDDGFQRVHGTLIRVLTDAGRHHDALEAAERARARAFADLLATRELTEVARAHGSATAAAAPATLASIRDQAQRSRSVIAAYWTDQDQTQVWTVSPSGRVSHATINATRDELASLVSRTRDPSEPLGGSSHAGSAYRRLYDMLLTPVVAAARDSATSRVTIIPHGPLFTLSFAALQAPDGRFAIERLALHYAPSVASLAALLPREHNVVTALVVSAPTYELQPSGDRLPPLPGAVDEGRAVARVLHADPTAILSRGQATEARVRTAAAQPAVLHFATHAMVFDDRPMDSYLALAPSNGDGGRGTDDDGRLTAEEIYGLRIEADVVVLSACRSGAGQVTGDGVVGLARAFFGAGATSVVASLWDLPDAVGPQLLPRFYRAEKLRGDRIMALRDAQLELLAELRAGRVMADTKAGPIPVPAHPTAWAGMILIGKP